jgi:DNA polymerase III delta subunit
LSASNTLGFFTNVEVETDFAILFANKNYQLCLEKAERALEKGNETMLITRGLMNYYNKLYTGKLALEEGKSIEEIIRNSQIFFKNEKDFRQNLQNISLKFIIKILQALEKLEINLKLSY